MELEITRSKDGRWHIEGYGMVWERELVNALKELIEEEEGWL